MKIYMILGGLRNLAGVAILTLLDSAGMSLNVALFITVSIGFILYVLQVNMTIGQIDVPTLLKLYLFVYFANRLMLWLLHEHLGWAIYIAQLVSIVLFSTGGYLWLKLRADKLDSDPDK